jgi:hypothetical protein
MLKVPKSVKLVVDTEITFPEAERKVFTGENEKVFAPQ